MTLALIPDSALVTINSLEIVGIIYLAIAVSNLRAAIAKLEGRTEERNHHDDKDK